MESLKPLSKDNTSLLFLTEHDIFESRLILFYLYHQGGSSTPKAFDQRGTFNCHIFLWDICHMTGGGTPWRVTFNGNRHITMRNCPLGHIHRLPLWSLLEPLCPDDPKSSPCFIAHHQLTTNLPCHFMTKPTQGLAMLHGHLLFAWNKTLKVTTGVLLEMCIASLNNLIESENEQ